MLANEKLDFAEAQLESDNMVTPGSMLNTEFSELKTPRRISLNIEQLVKGKITQSNINRQFIFNAPDYKREEF